MIRATALSFVICAAASCGKVGSQVERASRQDAGSSSAVRELMKSARTDPSASERAHAVWALGSLGGGGAVDVLREALADESDFVRTMAAEALGRNKVAGAVPELAHCLHDLEPHVRRAAITALQRIDDEPARAALAEHFHRHPVGRPAVAKRADPSPRK